MLSNITAPAVSSEVYGNWTEKASAPDVGSQHSYMVNTSDTATGSVNATSESSVYNVPSLEPATRIDTPSAGPFERVLLRNYTEFHAIRGKLTNRRRTKPSNQLE